MTQKNKASIMLAYSEIIYNSMQSPYKEELREVLDICWQWLETKDISGKEIYSYLDDGTDFGGIYILMQMDEDDTNIVKWDNLSYALSYVVFLAYKKDRETMVPAPIENIDDSIYDLFISNIVNIDNKLKQKLEAISTFVKSQSISKEMVLRFLKENHLI